MFQLKRAELKHYIVIFALIILALFSLYKLKEFKITGRVVSELVKIETDPSIVLKLTFDDSNDPWKDYSMYGHTFSANGGAKWADKNLCKWYGCADFSAAGDSDYINSTTKWKVDGDMSVCFWSYINENDLASNSQYY